MPKRFQFVFPGHAIAMPISHLRAASRPATHLSRLSAIILVLSVATLSAYARTLLQDFVNIDDETNFYLNPHLNPVTDLNFLHPLMHPYFQMYIPVSYIAFALISLVARMAHPDQAIAREGDLNPHVFHAVSLGLHLANVVLVFLLLRSLMTRAFSQNPAAHSESVLDFAAAAGAALFALHPVQVESVAWASQMRGLLAGLFSLAALLIYFPAQDARSRKRIAGAIVLGLLAMLSKPSAATLPLIALILDRTVRNRPWKQALPPVVIWLAVVAPFVVIAALVQPVVAVPAVPAWDRPLIAGDALAFYLGKVMWPLQLGLDYGRTPGIVLSHSWGHLTWLAPVGAAAALWALRRRLPWLAASGLVFLIVLAPVLGLTPFEYQAISTVADRYAYLAMLGPAIAVAFGLASIAASTRARRFLLAASGAMAVVIFGCLFLSMQQMSYWDDSEALMRHALSINPRSFVCEMDLAASFSEHRIFDEADRHYQAALAIRPASALAHVSRGMNLITEHHFFQATGELETGLRLDPKSSDGHTGLGLIALHARRPAEAVREFDQAVMLVPANATAWNGLGDALKEEDRRGEALRAYRQAVETASDCVPAYLGMADLALQRNDFSSVVADDQAVIQIDPTYVPAYEMLSAAYRRQGKMSEAARVLQDALASIPSYDPARQRLRALIAHPQ